MDWFESENGTELTDMLLHTIVGEVALALSVILILLGVTTGFQPKSLKLIKRFQASFIIILIANVIKTRAYRTNVRKENREEKGI